MGNSYRLEWSRDMSGSDELLDQALLFNRKSVALDENNDACHQDLGWILIHRNYDLAEHHLHKALQLMTCCRFDGRSVKLIPPYVRTQPG
jgi:hypothetical protein